MFFYIYGIGYCVQVVGKDSKNTTQQLNRVSTTRVDGPS